MQQKVVKEGRGVMKSGDEEDEKEWNNNYNNKRK